MNKASWSRFVILALAVHTLAAHAQSRPGQNSGSFPQYDDRRDPQQPGNRPDRPQQPQQPQQPNRPQQPQQPQLPQQPTQPIPPVVTQPQPIPQQPSWPQPAPQDDRYGRPDRDQYDRYGDRHDRDHGRDWDRGPGRMDPRPYPGQPYPQPYPQQYPQQYDRDVAAYSLVQLHINRDLYSGSALDLTQLVQDQLGETLINAEIDRVVVEGDPMMRGQALVGVELNGRLVGPMRPLSFSTRMLPLQVNSIEPVRSLRLLVNGQARIGDVSIRVGNVRSQYSPIPVPQPLPIPSRLYVNQEISPSYPLDLAAFTREFSAVRSLTLETTVRGYGNAELTLISRQGQIVGRAIAIQGRTIILLTIPTALSDIRIFTQVPVLVSAIDAEFDRPIGRR